MKPVLIGMNNPISSAPEFALYPHPDGCTGHRIWTMLHEVDPSIGRQAYVAAFDRMNVLSAKVWNTAAARANASTLLTMLDAGGRTFLLFGAQTRDAMHLPTCDLLTWQFPRRRGATWAWAPHPSGRNPWYNEAPNRRRLGEFLRAMYLWKDEDMAAGG